MNDPLAGTRPLDRELTIQEWIQLREDSRSFWTISFNAATLGIATLGGVSVLATEDSPKWVWLGLMSVSLVVMALLTQQLTLQGIRARREREVEELLAGGQGVHIPIPGVARLTAPMFEKGALFSPIWLLAVPNAVVFVLLVAISAGTGATAAVRIASWPGWVAAVLYEAILSLLFMSAAMGPGLRNYSELRSTAFRSS
jgi:hypothetical protein